MQILIQRREDRAYYVADGQWMADRKAAVIFPDVNSAVRVCITIAEETLLIINLGENFRDIELPFQSSHVHAKAKEVQKFSPQSKKV